MKLSQHQVKQKLKIIAAAEYFLSIVYFWSWINIWGQFRLGSILPGSCPTFPWPSGIVVYVHIYTQCVHADCLLSFSNIFKKFVLLWPISQLKYAVQYVDNGLKHAISSLTFTSYCSHKHSDLINLQYLM